MKMNLQKGIALINIVVFATIMTIVLSGLASWYGAVIQSARGAVDHEKAFQIAESGLEYYRWHLAHDQTDYRDGTGDDAPTSPLPNGLILWLDGQDVIGTGSNPSDGTPVTTWIDKSIRANHAVQIDSESVPLKQTDNGKEVVEFTSDQLITTNHLYPAKPADHMSAFIVARTTSTGSNGYLFRTKGNRISINLPWGNDKTRFDFRNTSQGRIQTDWTQNTNDYYLWGFENSTSEGKEIRVNSATIESETEGAPQAANPKELVIGRKQNSQVDYQQVNIAEMLIYDRILTEDDRDQVERYLDCKWEITGREDCTSSLPGETYGPFVHEVEDSDGNVIGIFSLNITSPPIGSTLVTIESTGSVFSTTTGGSLATTSRTIRTQLAIPSFVKFAFAADADMRFGAGTEVFGPIHSNGGIRFDGLAHNLVSSARETYDDPDHSGSNEFGVHTHDSPQDPNPPAAVPQRSDIFEAGRDFPVPTIDFNGMIADLAQMKTDAQANGHYSPSSGNLGYRIVLRTDDKFDLHRVTSLYSPHWSCNNALNEDGWGSWSINNDNFIATYDFPTNGIIFLEDHAWVEGTVDTARLTIVAARFPDTPSTRRSITINDDLSYTNHDGTDVVALIAQNNINIGLVSQDDLEVDAALIAQSGRIGRYYYRPPWSWYSGCSPYHERDTISTLGIIATKNRYGFAWTDNTGYDIRNITYDANLLYAPPPSFPLTSDEYETILWQEL